MAEAGRVRKRPTDGEGAVEEANAGGARYRAARKPRRKSSRLLPSPTAEKAVLRARRRPMEESAAADGCVTPGQPVSIDASRESTSARWRACLWPTLRGLR